MRIGLSWLSCCLLLANGLALRTALGAPCVGAECEPASARRIVRVALAGQSVHGGELEGLFSEWLAEEHELSFTHPEQFDIDDALSARSEPNTLYLWITTERDSAEEPERAIVYFALPERDRFLRREVPLDSGLDELGRERVAQIVQSSVTAIFEGNAGISRVEAERRFKPVEVVSRAPAPAPAPKPTAPWRLEAEALASYFIAARGEEAWSHGPGGAFALGAAREHWLGGVLAAHYHLPTRLETDEIILEFSELSLRASAAIRVPLDSRWSYGAGAGMGFDWVWAKPTARSEAVAATGSASDLRPLLTAWAALGLRTAIGSWYLASHLDAQLFDSHFDLGAANAAQRREIDAAAVVPRLQLSLGVP